MKRLLLISLLVVFTHSTCTSVQAVQRGITTSTNESVSTVDTNNTYEANAGVSSEPVESEPVEPKQLVYDSEDITKPSGITVDEMYALLATTSYQSWDNAKAFVEAENQSPSVNALFLLALTKQESLHGRSNLARKDNNISSWRLRSGKYKHFNSKTECIHDTAELLSKKYLTSGTEYYHGLSISDIELAYYYGITNENKLTKADMKGLNDKWVYKVNTITNELLVRGSKLRNVTIEN